VISPVGIGDDGESLDLHPEDVAAGVASAVNAEKLVYLTEAPGLLDGTEVVSEFTVEALRTKVASGAFSPTDERVARAALRAASAGVKNVHILDGRVPHAIIAELFTDNGVGTLLRANA
jgi:acetylglutamate kinase